MAGRSAESAKTLSELEESHGGADGSTGNAGDCGAPWPPSAMCRASPGAFPYYAQATRHHPSSRSRHSNQNSHCPRSWPVVSAAPGI